MRKKTQDKSWIVSCLAVILAAFLVIIPIALEPLAVFAAETVDQPFYQQSNTVTLGQSGEDSFASEFIVEISDEEDLIAFANRVNDGDAMTDYKVILMADIVITEKPWIPIGKNANTPFSGVFEGNGHSIKNIVTTSDTKGGLFGFLSNATVKGVEVLQPQARNSTAGLFYSAVSSGIELGNSAKNSRMQAFSMARQTYSNFTSPWDGTTKSDTWRSGITPVPAGNYEISSAEELADLAAVVNAGDMEAGSTIVLTRSIDLGNHEWTPIGDGVGVFEGHFVGNNNVIKNFKVTAGGNGYVGLFGFVSAYSDADGVHYYASSINGVTIENAQIVTSDAFAGALAGEVSDTGFSNIVVKDSTIHSIDSGGSFAAGGIVGTFGNGDEDTFVGITNCIVQNVSVTSDDMNAGGIAGEIFANAVNDNIISNVTLSAPDPSAYAGGIAGGAVFTPGYTMEFSRNIVLGLTISNTTENVAGITMHNDNDNPSLSMTNNIISGLQVEEGAALQNLYLGATEAYQAAQYNFTDSFLVNSKRAGVTYGFIDDETNSALATVINNNFWDTNTQENRVSSLPEDSNGNHGYSTAYLTNGVWVPNNNWVATQNHYPQLGSFAQTSDNAPYSDFIQSTSALAAAAIIPVYEEDIYSDDSGGARGIRLYTTAANGKEITWTVTGSDLVKDDSHAEYVQYDTNSNSALTVVASMNTELGTIYKYFDRVYIVDGILREDKNKRIDHGYSESKPPVVPLEKEIQLTYLEDVTANPDVTGNAELWALRDDGNYHMVQSIPVDQTAQDVFTISSNKRAARVFFALTPGNTYKAVFPKGFVVEDGKGNASEKVTVFFKTDMVGLPVIDISADKVIGEDSSPMTMEEIFTGVKIYRNKDYENTTVTIYDSARDGVPTRYTGTWKSDNPTTSAREAAASLPDGADTVEFYFEDYDKVINNKPKAGNYIVYILAKNKEGRSTYRAVNVLINGQPMWADGAPEPVVHIPWTKDIKTLKTAAKQGTSAVVQMNEEFYVPVPVRMEVPEAEWEGILDRPDIPAVITVTVCPLTQSGKASNLSCEVTVYLDKPLAYNLTPSPVVVSYTTPRQIEELINFEAINFKHGEVKYDHWSDTYRKPGMYHVEVYTDDQFVTLCPEKKCGYADHPSKFVHEYFDVQVIDPLGPEIQAFWGEVSRDIEDPSFSKEIIQVKPSSYLLPNYVLNLLQQQQSGKLQVSFFDEYRWNVYSSTLNSNYKWGEVYSLRVDGATNKNIDKLLENKDSAVQFVFEQEGKLFGTTEFEINLEKARKEYPDLPNKNLGLYRYEPETKGLVLVSEMLIDKNGEWASAMIDEVLPTTYVIKSMGTSEKVKVFSVIETGTRTAAETVDTSTMSAEKEKSGFIVDSGVITTDEMTNRSFLGGKQIDTSNIHVDTSATTINTLLIVAAILTLLTVFGIVAYRKIRKGEQQDEAL